jgi:hypothetical protein
MHDLKPSETLPPKGAKLARVSRILGWCGLVIAASTILLLSVLSPYPDPVEVVVAPALGLGICMGVASVLCAWRARVCFALSQAPAKGKGHGVCAVPGWICLLLVAINVTAIPYCVRVSTTAGKNACINHLRQIDGAKLQWALEYKKTDTDTPTWHDLVGTDKYLKAQLRCPANGKYTIGNVKAKPVCSKATTLPGHSLP